MVTMRVGWTSTQAGMTQNQKNALHEFLDVRGRYLAEFHHGDCIGGDSEAHNIVTDRQFGATIRIHPPTDPKKRAFCIALWENFTPRPYLQRNRDIVDMTDVLIATPRTTEEVLRSGTWATVRYAKKIGRPVIMFYPCVGPWEWYTKPINGDPSIPTIRLG